MSKIYVAYGMNLDRTDFMYRCATAQFLGLGTLADHRLLYKGGGHADVVEAQGCTVPVAIWSIEAEDEEELDFLEGYPDYYRKETVSVTVTHDAKLLPATGTRQGMLYKMQPGYDVHLPSYGYENILRRAYRDFGWDQKQLDEAYAASKG